MISQINYPPIPDRLILGKPSASRRYTIKGVIIASGLIPLQGFLFTSLYPGACTAVILSLALAVGLCDRSELILDFQKGYYYLDSGFGIKPQVSCGPLRDIQAVILTREVITAGTGSYRNNKTIYQAMLKFRVNGRQQEFILWTSAQMDILEAHYEKVLFALALARRLDVCLMDDSGWNCWRDPIENPVMITVRPGETHTALVYKGKKN